MTQYNSKKVDPTEYRVPRNFKLLDELESSEKGEYTDSKKYGDDCNWVNLGLDGQDATFTHWNATIIPHSGGHIGDRIYNLKLTAGPGYPDDPPLCRFVQKVAMPCVDSRGQVNLSLLKGGKFRWTRESSMFDVLIAIRQELKPTAIAQQCRKIPPGTTY